MTAGGRAGADGPAWTGRRVLALMIGFFAVVAAANGALVAFALSSWSGLSTENAYLKGLKHDATIAAARRQAALGWSSRVELSAGPEGGGVLVVHLAGSDGQGLSGLQVAARMMRPASAGFDRVLDLAPAGEGAYAGVAPPPLAGQWDVEVAAVGRGGARYAMLHRVVVRP